MVMETQTVFAQASLGSRGVGAAEGFYLRFNGFELQSVPRPPSPGGA